MFTKETALQRLEEIRQSGKFNMMDFTSIMDEEIETNTAFVRFFYFNEDGKERKGSERVSLYLELLQELGELSERDKAKRLFIDYINSVPDETIHEDAKEYLNENPTQWHREVERMLLDMADCLDDKELGNRFKGMFENYHERLGVSMSLKSFVEWLQKHEISIELEKTPFTKMLMSKWKDDRSLAEVLYEFEQLEG